MDEIFNTIGELCEDDPRRFVCVLIDEVESIAGCRKSSTGRGEAQDALRATNALLTGIDRVNSYANIIILCTSNLASTLDAAFIDRCGLLLEVDSPSRGCQYSILRGRIQRLILRGVIKSQAVLPDYRDSKFVKPGPKLNKLVELIDNSFSGRSLTQLPEQAILRYLRVEDCDLDMAFQFMEQFVLAQQKQKQGSKRKREREDTSDSQTD